MEENIKLLEEFINNDFQIDKLERNEKGGFKIGTIYKATELNPAIEKLIKGYKDLELSVDQIYDDYQDAGRLMFEYGEKLEIAENKIKNLTGGMERIIKEASKEFIPASLIKEKIEELKETADEDNLDDFIRIQVLEEILKEEK